MQARWDDSIGCGKKSRDFFWRSYRLEKLFSVSDDELLGYKKEKPSADGEELTPEEKELYEILDSCGPDMVKAILEVAKIIKNREGG